MTAFSHGELSTIQWALDNRMKMRTLCHMFWDNHSRDELVEAIDALRRNDSITGAMRHVNHVLALQSVGEPLINGNPQNAVARNWSAWRPAAMF